MCEEDVDRIAAETISEVPVGRRCFHVRKRLMEQMIDELAPEIPKSHREVLMRIEEFIPTFNTLITLPDMAMVVINTETIEKVVLLFEQWRALVQFLLDAYDDAPEEFKRSWIQQQLLDLMWFVNGRHEIHLKSFAGHLTTLISKDELGQFGQTITVVRSRIFGKERWQRCGVLFVSLWTFFRNKYHEMLVAEYSA